MSGHGLKLIQRVSGLGTSTISSALLDRENITHRLVHQTPSGSVLFGRTGQTHIPGSGMQELGSPGASLALAALEK